MELATAADIRIASEARAVRPARAQPRPPARLGGTQRLRAIVGEGRAKEIIFTARRDYDPETMYDYDFVNEVVANDEFEARVAELTSELAAGPPVAQKFTKMAMHAGRDDTDAGLSKSRTSPSVIYSPPTTCGRGWPHSGGPRSGVRGEVRRVCGEREPNVVELCSDGSEQTADVATRERRR